MIKFVFSRFALLLLAALLLHAAITLYALTLNSKDNTNDNQHYTSALSSGTPSRDFEAARFAKIFNIAAFVPPDAPAKLDEQETVIAVNNLKVLAITFNGTDYQAVIAIQQRDKADVVNVKLGDNVADFTVASISKFQVVLTTAINEELALNLFKATEKAQASDQNKDN